MIAVKRDLVFEQVSTSDSCVFVTIKIKSVILLDFSLTVKAATLIFISGCVSAVLSAKEGKSGFI